MPRPKKVKKSPASPMQVLAWITELGINKKELYESFTSIAANPSRVLPYERLQELAKKCYPNYTKVYDFFAEINLQALMDHTARRLLMHLHKDVQGLSEAERQALQLKCKWGCDGSEESAYDNEDDNIIQSSCMPQQLVCTLNNKVIWQNNVMWSTRYCRPIRIRFGEITTMDIIREEMDDVISGISTLKASKITLNNKEFTIQHTMMYTLVDQEVCNVTAHTNAIQKCYVCDLTTNDFNNLTLVKNVENSTTELHDWGLSIAHIRVRLLENLLHLSYKLPLKKWEITDDNDKAIVKQRKKDIKDKFENELNLLVDGPKTVGISSYNDGYASRRFFQNPAKTAAITGIQIDLIKRFKCILEVITSHHKINMDAFVAYTQQTAELYVALYPWYPMTLTLHKILMHTRNVIEYGIVAIGQTTRAISKQQRKHVPFFKGYHYYKSFSKQDANEKIFKDLMVRSDPVIVGLSSDLTSKKKLRLLLNDTRQMLLPDASDLTQANDDSDEEVDEDDSELSSDEN